MQILYIGIFLSTVIAVFYLRYALLLFSMPKKLKLAIRMMEKNREEEAIRLLTFIVNFDRTNTAANWLLANIYLRKGQYILAQMYLYDILYSNKFTKEVSEAEVRETLAYLYSRTGEYNKALIQYLLLKKHNLLSVPSAKKAIRQALEENNYREAALLLKQIKNLDTSDGEIDTLDAMIDFNNSAFSLAERKLKCALEKSYQDSEVDFLLGKIYFFTRKYDLALYHFQKLAERGLNREELESFMGQCLYYLKDYDSTIQVLENFIKNFKGQQNKLIANIEYILGCAHESKGQVTQALEIWRHIEDYAPYFQPIKEKLFFYNRIAKDHGIRELITIPQSQFIQKAEHLVEKMNYIIKQKLLEEERNLEYICIAKKNTELFNLTFIHISRKSQSMTLDELEALMIRARRNRARFVIVIAPHFQENALIWAKNCSITLHTLEVFS